MILTLARDIGAMRLLNARIFGELYWSDDQVILQTIERPWVPSAAGLPCGASGLSCAPLGIYDLILHDTPTHPKTWALHNPDLLIFATPPPYGQPGRSELLLHPDNLVETLEGCIGPGMSRGTLNGEPAVLESVKAFALLKENVPWVSGHQLIITEST